MNYINKIKSIGFKKIPTIVICDDGWFGQMRGPYFKTLEKFKEDNIKNKTGYSRIFGQNMPLSFTDKLVTYKWKLSTNISLYIFLIKSDYLFAVEDKTKIGRIEHGKLVNDQIAIHIPIRNITDTFWKDIISSVGLDIKREIIIKNIFKF